jgi:hypothetical protein
MSFPLFLMLAAIVLKLGRVADTVDPQPSSAALPSCRTWEGIKFWFAEITAGLFLLAIGGVILLLCI